ncbi:hypothetical protein BDW62DRAFT_205397 [Aspergillus aurantiobrunneus]
MELINLILDHTRCNINSGPAASGGATALKMAYIRVFQWTNRSEGAAEHGRIDMLQMLLDKGASVTGVDGQRRFNRAIMFAEENGHHAAARLLMSFEPRWE